MKPLWVCALLWCTLPWDGSAQGLARTTLIRDLEYGRSGSHHLLLDLGRPTMTVAGRMPAVIWIHGGAWRGGDKAQNPTAALVARGYITASINYRFANQAPFPAAVEDCKCAVRWLRANADKYQIDPDRIGVWGASAGGHLAAFLGVTADDPRFEGQGGSAGQSSRVQTVVTFAAPLDFTGGTNQVAGRIAGAVSDFLGASFKAKPDLYQLASPISHVGPKTAPMLLVHGDRDSMVPLDQSVRMAEALEKAGVEAKLVIVKNAEHGFLPATAQAVSPNPLEIQQMVLAWFDRHLKGAPDAAAPADEEVLER